MPSTDLAITRPDVVLQPGPSRRRRQCFPSSRGAGFRVHPHVAVHHGHREAAHVVGEGIEGAAAGYIEAGMVPVAGEDAVPDAAPVQGKAPCGDTGCPPRRLLRRDRTPRWRVPSPVTTVQPRSLISSRVPALMRPSTVVAIVRPPFL